jgi:hypothetical protein
MIPKPGDTVVIDPWYWESLFESEDPADLADGILDSTLKVVHVGEWSPELLAVTVQGPHLHTFFIDRKTGGGACAGDHVAPPSFFMVSLDTLVAERLSPPMSDTDLERLNSDPAAIECAKCGTTLSNPIPELPILKHCPQCQP